VLRLLAFTTVLTPSLLLLTNLRRTRRLLTSPRPFQVVSDAMNKPLEKTINKSDSLPGVSGDYMLTQGEFGAPGSRHIVCQSDGTSTEEEALEHEDAPASSHFRYIVWNYTTPKARPIAYGVGEFRTVQLDSGHTRITWTYSFKLKEDVFPGEFGALGRWLFRVRFLEGEYAAMMKDVLNGYKQDAEERQAGSRDSFHFSSAAASAVLDHPNSGAGNGLSPRKVCFDERRDPMSMLQR
jgi:hypothetical protein